MLRLAKYSSFVLLQCKTDQFPFFKCALACLQRAENAKSASILQPEMFQMVTPFSRKM